MEEVNLQSVVEWGLSTTAFPGQAVSGDLHLLEVFSSRVIVAVVDGLGHGKEAAEAASRATNALRVHSDEDVKGMVKGCHEALLQTRGVALSLAAFDGNGLMTWCGVGNVEAVLFHGVGDGRIMRERILQDAGVVGYQLPALHTKSIPVRFGDVLILATDGICTDFADDLNLSKLPQQIADGILSQHSRGSDDALVMVVRYLGKSYGNSA